MITRILFFIGTLVLGLGIIKYTFQWVNLTGKSQWVEEKVGSGASYMMWKAIAILLIIFGFLVLLGQVKLSAPAATPVDQNSATIQS